MDWKELFQQVAMCIVMVFCLWKLSQERNLLMKRWVEESLPFSVTNVVDAYLLRTEKDYASMENCMSSIMRLALQCCDELHEQRINAKRILITLNKIKLNFLQDIDGS